LNAHGRFGGRTATALEQLTQGGMEIEVRAIDDVHMVERGQHPAIKRPRPFRHRERLFETTLHKGHACDVNALVKGLRRHLGFTGRREESRQLSERPVRRVEKPCSKREQKLEAGDGGFSFNQGAFPGQRFDIRLCEKQ
jgi:hypothetical protein